MGRGGWLFGTHGAGPFRTPEPESDDDDPDGDELWRNPETIGPVVLDAGDFLLLIVWYFCCCDPLLELGVDTLAVDDDRGDDENCCSRLALMEEWLTPDDDPLEMGDFLLLTPVIRL